MNAPGLARSSGRRHLEFQPWALSQGVSSWLGDLRPYEACRIAGIVDRLVIDPGGGVITASLDDGTGSVLAEWHIRRPTPELSAIPGRAVVLEGVAYQRDDGGLALRDPVFSTHSYPESA